MVNKFSLIKTLFTVDGRKLNTHNVIKNIQFTKIVFMFPHVGGKMKINLNRDLLMAIFESAHQVLDNTGEHIINTPLGALDGIGLGASWPSIFIKFKKEKVKLFWKLKENFLFRDDFFSKVSSTKIAIYFPCYGQKDILLFIYSIRYEKWPVFKMV